MNGQPVSQASMLLSRVPKQSKLSVDVPSHRNAWQRELQHARSIVGLKEREAGTAQIVGFLQGFGDVKAELAPLGAATVGAAAQVEFPEFHAASGAETDGPAVSTGVESHKGSQAPVCIAAAPFPRPQRAAQKQIMQAMRPITGAPVQSTKQRASIRVHSDWSTDGVRIWLGVDANTASAVQSIANQLQRWLVAKGVRGLAIVCNGRTLVECWPDAQELNPVNPIAMEGKEKT